MFRDHEHNRKQQGLSAPGGRKLCKDEGSHSSGNSTPSPVIMHPALDTFHQTKHICWSASKTLN